MTKWQRNLGGVSESHSSSTVCNPVKRRVTFSSATAISSNDIDRVQGYDVMKRLVCLLANIP